MRLDYDFLLTVRVFDPECLRTLALAHEDAQPNETFVGEEGEVDVESCLVVLLDPGKLNGCSIYGSSANTDGRIDAGDYEFSMSLSVHDPEALRAAALQHQDAQPDDTFLSEDGSVDIDACLVMVLDPGCLSGCSIYSSSASQIDSLLASRDDEECVDDRSDMTPGCQG